MKITISILTQILFIVISAIIGIWTSIVYLLFTGLHILVFGAHNKCDTPLQYTESILQAMTPAVQRVPTITIIVSVICVVYFTIKNIKNNKQGA